MGASLARPERAEAVAKGARSRGIAWEATGFVDTADGLARAIATAHKLGAHHLNVQVMARFDRVADAVACLTAMERHAAGAGIPVYYETHRGRLTNDMLFTLRVLDAMPGLRLTGDLSHYPLVHELPLPVPEADLARISRVLDHCWAFHGRVSGSHQVQVSLTAPRHQPWVEQFRRWWAEGFVNWRARAGEGAELTFMCELGPPDYAITMSDGRELTDRWAEACLMQAMVRELWSAGYRPRS